MTAIHRLQPVIPAGAPSPAPRGASADVTADLFFSVDLASAQGPFARAPRGVEVQPAKGVGTKSEAKSEGHAEQPARTDAAAAPRESAGRDEAVADEAGDVSGSQGEGSGDEAVAAEEAQASAEASDAEPVVNPAAGSDVSAVGALAEASARPGDGGTLAAAQSAGGVPANAVKPGVINAADPLPPSPVIVASQASASSQTSTDSDDAGTQGEAGARGNTGNTPAASATAQHGPPPSTPTPTINPTITPSAENAASPGEPASRVQVPGQSTHTAGLPDAPEGGDDALNAARLSRGLKSALNQQGGSVTLRLTPPELGTVRIQMQLQGASVSARFHAESDGARSLLQQQLGQLRSSLESQGLTVDRLSVQTMSGSGASSFSGGDPDGASSDGRSRGQYTPQQHQGGEPSPQDQPPGERRRPRTFADLLSPAERN